jgi:hypothetical protein
MLRIPSEQHPSKEKEEKENRAVAVDNAARNR